MPSTGTFPRRSAACLSAPETAAGSPGPLLSTTAAGLRARMSAALVRAGTTVTPQPTSAREQAGHLRLLRLLVAMVNSVVADFTHREGDELPGVRGVGEDLLVPGVRGVEDHLALRLAIGAASEALERLSAGEREHGLLHG